MLFETTAYPTCAANEIPTDVGGDAPVCLTQSEWDAVATAQAGQGITSKSAVNVSPKAADSWTNIALYGGLALGALLLLGGRRR